MPLRNPFRRSGPSDLSVLSTTGDREFNNASVAGTQPIDDQEAAEYQLSEINDSGVFVPPSPAASKPSFWHTKSNSSISSNHRSLLSDTEPFNMSRQSFDSYRRSFDISARSPIASLYEPDSRRSLDSSLLLSPPQSLSLYDRLKTDWPAEEEEEEEEEEELEDVQLADEQQNPPQPPQPRRRGLFARFSETSERPPPLEARERELGIKPAHSFQLFSGRKKGLSGQGDELKSISRTGAPTISAGGE